jgi:hypothetical protein
VTTVVLPVEAENDPSMKPLVTAAVASESAYSEMIPPPLAAACETPSVPQLLSSTSDPVVV